MFYVQEEKLIHGYNIKYNCESDLRAHATCLVLVVVLALKERHLYEGHLVVLGAKPDVIHGGEAEEVAEAGQALRGERKGPHGVKLGLRRRLLRVRPSARL